MISKNQVSKAVAIIDRTIPDAETPEFIELLEAHRFLNLVFGRGSEQFHRTQAHVAQQRNLAKLRTRNDFGPSGYWQRKESGKKDWKNLPNGRVLGDLNPFGRAPQRRMAQQYSRNVKKMIARGEI